MGTMCKEGSQVKSMCVCVFKLKLLKENDCSIVLMGLHSVIEKYLECLPLSAVLLVRQSYLHH